MSCRGNNNYKFYSTLYTFEKFCYHASAQTAVSDNINNNVNNQTINAFIDQGFSFSRKVEVNLVRWVKNNDFHYLENCSNA